MKKYHFSSLDSSNLYLKDNYKSLENYTFVSCDYQTDGRGRNNREWLSENSKNLLFSLLILDKRIIEQYKKISILTAYAIVQILIELGIKDVKIKWPNDVYVKDKKICGILLESISHNEIDCLIVGVGLNVNQDIFNGDYRVSPTSLKCELKKDIDINELKDSVYNRLIKYLNNLLNKRDYYDEIVKFDYLKGKEAYFENDTVKIIGIDKDYSLKIVRNDQDINIFSGEICL